MKKGLLYLFLFSPLLLWAQAGQIKGVIVSGDDGEPLPGVSIRILGEERGSITGIDGSYSIAAEKGNILVFSFVGFKNQEIAVGSESTIDVTLELDNQLLDEVVVVGYGTQKEKDLTSAITTLKSDEIVKSPSGQTMQALQGKVAGVQIVSNGAPGNEPTVRIRGIGSFPSSSGSSPLYVVDGMFFDNIDFLNTSEIESLSVLKDASAAAIYGVRAANGVVLITTKGGGLNQKSTISYDGYIGVQVPKNVLKMANAEQFVDYVNQTGSTADISLIDNAMQRFGRSRINPNVPNVNTDWYSEVMEPARITNHALTIAGGSDNTTYSVGVSYFDQEGLLKTKNSYKRFNIRSKVDHYANGWLKVGGNLNLSNGVKYTADNAAWWRAYHAVPILPIFDETNTDATPEPFASAQILGYRGGQNPFVNLNYQDNRLDIRKILSGVYGEIDIIPNKLKFRSSYNVSMTFLKERNVGLPYFITSGLQRENSTLSSTRSTFINQFVDNTLTFNQTIGDHNFTVMAGHSFRDESFEFLRGSAENIPTDSEKTWYIDQTLDDASIDAGDGARRVYGISYFGRTAYNYQGKYLAYFTIRADGTNKYQEKWGYFPAVGLGWVVSQEPFLQGSSTFNFLKVRAGWGQLGNDAVAASDGQSTTSAVDLAIDDTQVTGTSTLDTFDFLRWELVSETNVGITAELLDSRLSVDMDYFIRDTENAAIPVSLLLQSGSVNRSVGTIRNSGFEMALNWNGKISEDVKFFVGVNFATLKNEVIDLFGQSHIDGGTAEFRQRTIVGEPLFAFFGLKRAGVYQTQAEVDADPIAIAEGLVPGDLKFVDQDEDGDIDGDDRVVLGSYFPNLTYGGNIGASYKNIELSMNIMGQRGNKILNRKRGELIFTQDTNVDADLATGVWNGEGTSNTYPSAAGLRRGWNQQLSDYLIEDGAFFRIQNVRVAYNFRDLDLGSQMLNATVYFTAERPLTVFNYNGFNPEVANGVDRQVYPIPAVYTIGFNLKF